MCSNSVTAYCAVVTWENNQNSVEILETYHGGIVPPDIIDIHCYHLVVHLYKWIILEMFSFLLIPETSGFHKSTRK